jgi:hypothetical protein
LAIDVSKEALMTDTNAHHEIPPGRLLFQLTTGHYVTNAIAAIVQLGIADAIGDEPRAVDYLAEVTQVQPAPLRRVMRFLTSFGVFAELDDGRFALSPLGDLLREDVPGSMTAIVRLFGSEMVQNYWRDFAFCLRTGEPAFKKLGPDANPFTAFADDPEAAANFDKAMATFAPQSAAAVASAYDFGGFDTVVDVGGGNGALLIGILSQYPDLRGVVFDLPDVAGRAETEIDAAGLGGRLAAEGGSFFEAVPEGRDVNLLKHVIHDWNDEDAGRILAVCRKAMPAHAKLLVVEGLYPARIDGSVDSRGATANDVNMLVATGGRQRSEDEFRHLFTDAGLELTRIVPTAASVSVIEGVGR